MKAGHVLNNKDWSPKQIDLSEVEDFLQKIPNDGEIGYYEAYQLAVESARLLDYMANLKGKVELFYLRARSEYRQLFELKSIEHNPKSVADGERKSHADSEVCELRQQRDYAEAYKVLMEEKYEVLVKIHYLMKQRHKEAQGEESRSSYD